jgi:tetratricopeptide (TPR) repeat protein
MKIIQLFFFLLPLFFLAQPNCKAYLYSGDTLKFKACILVEDANKKHYQFSKEFQQTLDEAINICPSFAYAYKEKAAAYVKSGDFITWKKLIDNAVKYAPKEFLPDRASLRYKFFADYKGAIDDINLLDSLVDYDIGYSINGTYHLNIVKGLCYKKIGLKKKAISIIENQLKKNNEFLGAYDYLHLGVLFLETNQIDQAITCFNRQRKEYNLAENSFYTALAYKKKNNTEYYLKFLKEAKYLYENEKRMFDPYNQLIDEIFLKTIENELILAEK